MHAHTFVEPHLRVVCVCGVERGFRLFPASTACSLLVQEVRAECFYGNRRRMLAKLRRCAVVITSCSSSHRETLDVQTKYGVISLFSSCFQFVNITENKKTEIVTIYNKSSFYYYYYFSSLYLLALRPLLF